MCVLLPVICVTALIVTQWALKKKKQEKTLDLEQRLQSYLISLCKYDVMSMNQNQCMLP